MQEGSAHNGRFGCACYHPLFVFNQFGDLEQSTLRRGNVHSADDWRPTLEPVVARYRGCHLRRYFVPRDLLRLILGLIDGLRPKPVARC